jgi:RND family efflux transporter MFP subunit
MKIYARLNLAVAILFAGAANAAEYDCMIEARQKVDIRSPVEAVIESVLVQRGDLVKKGQIMITLESGPERAALDIAKSRATMLGEIQAAQARVELTRLKLVRAEELYKQNFVSMNALDEAQADIQLATEQLRQAQENKKLAVLDVTRVSEVLAMRTIKSPFSGVVVEVMQKPGEFSGSNIKDPILKLAEIDPLHVEVVLPVSLHGQIAVGTQGDVMPEQPIGGKYTAAVRVVDRVVDAASGTFGVRLEMPNRAWKIPAGVRCRVKFK